MKNSKLIQTYEYMKSTHLLTPGRGNILPFSYKFQIYLIKMHILSKTKVLAEQDCSTFCIFTEALKYMYSLSQRTAFWYMCKQ